MTLIYRLSNLLDEHKQKRSFEHWVSLQQGEILSRAYDKRNTIDKKGLACELGTFATLANAYSRLKKLRKKSTGYDVVIKIDKYGYHTFEFCFPVTREEYDKAISNKVQLLKKYGGGGIVRFDECLYDVCKDRINKEFNFLEMTYNNIYDYKKNYVASIHVTKFS